MGGEVDGEGGGEERREGVGRGRDEVGKEEEGRGEGREVGKERERGGEG